MTEDPGTAHQAAQLAEYLIARTHEVGRVSGRTPLRDLLRRLSRGRWGRRSGWPVIPILDTPWQDTIAAELPGWRTRAANTGAGEFAVAVDYQVCTKCRRGWVEQPYTLPQYQRHGLARAALAALRDEHPSCTWHTLGGHLRDAQPFWAVVGAGVPGGYQQHPVCDHVRYR